MSFFARTKKRENYALVYNFSSGAVTAALIKITKETGVNVLLYAKEALAFQLDFKTDQYLSNLGKAISSVTNIIHQDGVKQINLSQTDLIKIDTIYYIFSTPWSHTETHTIKVKENKAIKLSPSFFTNLVKKEIKNTDNQHQLIENHITQIKVNGYTLDVPPKNLLAKEAEITVLTSYVEIKIIELINQAINKVFIVEQQIYHSNILAEYSTLRDLFSNQTDYLNLNITEEITELTLIKEGNLHSQATFPIGRNTLVRDLANQTKSLPAVADSLIQLAGQSAHNLFAGLSTKVALDLSLTNWQAQFTEIINHLSASTFLPQNIFLLSYGDLSDIIANKLKQAHYSVTVLNPKRIISQYKIDDIAFKIVLVFLDKIYKI